MSDVEPLLAAKTSALLRFLKDVATLRRKRNPAYGANDKILWLAEVPRDRPECRSAFLADNPAEFPDLWLEVRKKRMPVRPPVPELAKDWISHLDLDKTDQEPELLPEITVLVSRNVPDPDAPPEQGRIVNEKVPELRLLKDHPEVVDAWHNYLVSHWRPWAQEMLRWQEIQRVYEDVDFMRRRLEESDERYELVLMMGLLTWRDSGGTAVKRHLLSAPAEISLDAARGVLTVTPAAAFEAFRVELDMLELRDQPRLEGTGVDDLLEELDVQAWDKPKVARILRIIVNRTRPDAQLDENATTPFERTDETPRVAYAPALVLRERRPTAYEELINRFLKDFATASSPSTTKPWERFIREGQPSSSAQIGPTEHDSELGGAAGQLFFPLPTNEEQRRIAERLHVQPFVLVKGPPGTGKSHTIANLICHLLALGDRILVTAHAPKALTVLRDLLPADIRDLCVTALGSTREDQRLLEDSVRGILWRKNEWRGVNWANNKLAELENEFRRLNDQRVRVDRSLRECREAETHSHTLYGGYQGTSAQIARQLELERNAYEWFPEISGEQKQCPLGPKEIAFLAEVHSRLTEEQVSELSLETGSFPLPDPKEFERAVATLRTAEKAAEDVATDAPRERVDLMRRVSQDVMEKTKAFLYALEGSVARASRVLGTLTDEILKDLLVGQEARWNRLAQDSTALLKSMDAAREQAGKERLDLPSDVPRQQLLADARRRLDHFKKGGRRGVGFLAPRVVRETRYIEERCRVEAHMPREPQSLAKLVAFLEMKTLVEQFSQDWPASTTFAHLDPRLAARSAADLIHELNQLLALFRNRAPDALAAVFVSERVDLASPVERAKWLSLIGAEVSIRMAHRAREPLETWLMSIRRVAASNPHHCIRQMAQAVEERNSVKWEAAWEIRKRLEAEKECFRYYQKLLDQIEEACPGLRTLLGSNQGNPEWKNRLASLDKAWAWSTAQAWLRGVSENETSRHQREERNRLQDKIEKKVEELAALKAWLAFFGRLDDPTEQNLAAWTKAVDRIGKGTGKYAYRHRRTARQYLMTCIPKIPAWIMPLYKIWDTTSAEPGLFDTVIVDEASQAGIESLSLFMLAKRIVVVGDDKQNSPEAVGVLEDDIARLARDHLREFRFRDEFRPDTSLFDHSERAFGNLISLREHFRCVPEIIRFSNDLCYTDAPLIPLRQPPPNRLKPLLATFVSSGSCDGEGQRINNRAEAERIVKVIQECLDDEAYEGKTMGVIVLQGHAQAELIEKRLAEILEPKTREERKLRCGVPATFQGDQRDVIFLSLVVAPNHRYRALTGLPDQRRFNVAMSRARDQTWLFHSVQLHDLSREDFRWRLLNFFHSPGLGAMGQIYEELDRLEREAKRSPRRIGEHPDPYESWFEVDVTLELLRRKYRVCPQYDVAGYRIDLVVEGLETRLAVECDGDAWHGPEKYEQDMARQRQLGRAGWTFARIPESEFYANRDRAMQQVIEECERLDIRPVDQVQLTPPQKSARKVSVVSQETLIVDSNDATPPDTDTEGTELIKSESTAKFGPFTSYSAACGFPDPRNASSTNVRAALRQIVEKEGPITKASVFRLYVEGSPDLKRAGKAVRRELNRALWAMVKAGEIVQEDELGDRSHEGAVVRLAGTPKVRERVAGARDLLEIPPSELLVVLGRICASAPSVQQSGDAMCRALLDHYGFTRLTEVRKKHLARIFNILHQQSPQPSP